MRTIQVTVLASLVFALAGCQHTQQTTGPLGRGDIQQAKETKITAETYYAAGQLAEASNKPAVAIKNYQACIKADPKHSDALYRLGVVYAQEKRFVDSQDIWKQYLKVTDNDANGWSNLGFAHELAGESNAAEAAYRQGIAKDPKNVACRTNYGLMMARNGHVNEALLQLQTVLTPADAHYDVASVLEQQGNRLAAKAEYKKALDLNPTMVDAEVRLVKLDD